MTKVREYPELYLGALCEPLPEQLKKQGFGSLEGEGCEKLHHAVNILKIQKILPDYEASKAYKRIEKRLKPFKLKEAPNVR